MLSTAAGNGSAGTLAFLSGNNAAQILFQKVRALIALVVQEYKY